MDLIAASSMLIAALICLPLTAQAEEVIINAVGDAMLSNPLNDQMQSRDGRYVVPF